MLSSNTASALEEAAGLDQENLDAKKSVSLHETGCMTISHLDCCCRAGET